jgi:phytoene dehydrogenase-like protein
MNRRRTKVLVIGSGVGGAAIAALLSHRGCEVTVLEKLGFIGGRCCSRERDGFTIDLGVHTFSQAGAGPLGEVLRVCGHGDRIEWSYTTNPTQKLNYLGTLIEYPKGVGLLGVDPEEYRRIVGAIVAMPGEEIAALNHTSLRDWLNRQTAHPVLHAIFAYIAELYFIVPYWDASAGEFIRSMQAQARKRASGYPVGGCRKIPQSYLDVVTACGNEVRTSAPVKRILVDHGRSVGVELRSGEILRADLVISNADPKITVLQLAGEEHFPADYVSRIKRLRYTPAACVLKLALRKKITQEKFVMYISQADPAEYYGSIERGQIPERVNLMVPVVSNLDPGTAPEGHQLIIAGTFPVLAPDEEAWQRAVMRSVEEVFPGIRDHILFVEGTHGREVEALMGEGGGMIGLAQTTDQVGEKRLAQTTPVANLYLVGAEAGGWGIGTELAANSALELNAMIQL